MPFLRPLLVCQIESYYFLRRNANLGWFLITIQPKVQHRVEAETQAQLLYIGFHIPDFVHV
jgi:hypothetical protein